MVNAQEWLDKEWPLEIRKETTVLEINKKNLEGRLVISGWNSLRNINLSNNQINSLTLDNLPRLSRLSLPYNKVTDLIINNCLEINYLDVGDNLLTNLDFLNGLKTEKLTQLDIANNRIIPQDLSVFSRFVNLDKLWIARNDFNHSLEYLKNLTKLRNLNISWTNVDSDLEYLTEDLKNFSHHSCEEIEEKLKRYDGNLKNWRKDHPELIEKIQEEKILNIGNLSSADNLQDENSLNSWDEIFLVIQKEINYLQRVSEQQLQELQKENNELAKKLENYNSLQSKEKELAKLKSICLAKLSEYEDVEEKLDELLELEVEIVINNSEYAFKQKVKVREKLIRKTKLVVEEIDKICQLQKEIIQSKISIVKQKRRFSQSEIQQITNYYNISVQHGNAIVGNQFGDNTNLNYQVEEKIEIPPK